MACGNTHRYMIERSYEDAKGECDIVELLILRVNADDHLPAGAIL